MFKTKISYLNKNNHFVLLETLKKMAEVKKKLVYYEM